MKYCFDVEGMMCLHCEQRLAKGLAETPGIRNVRVSLGEKMAEVETDLPPEQVIKRIDEIGFDAKLK